MKRFIACAWMVLASMVAMADGPGGATVSTNSIMIAPKRGVLAAADFPTNTAVSQGVVYKAQTRYYWVKIAGTTTNSLPTGLVGEVTNGTAVLKRIPVGPRNGITVVNTSPSWSSLVYLSIGVDAVSGKGIPIYGCGGSWTSESGVTQEGIRAISSITNAAVSVMEW